MSEHHSAPPAGLCSWPPSPALLSIHLIVRTIVVISDLSGIVLLFIASTEWGVEDHGAGIVGGSFLIVSIILTPFIMIWNALLLRRVKKLHAKQQQSQDVDIAPPRFKTKALKFVTFLEGLGAISYLVVFFPVIIGATGRFSSWYSGGSTRVAYAYGSVSVLCAA